MKHLPKTLWFLALVALILGAVLFFRSPTPPTTEDASTAQQVGSGAQQVPPIDSAAAADATTPDPASPVAVTATTAPVDTALQPPPTSPASPARSFIPTSSALPSADNPLAGGGWIPREMRVLAEQPLVREAQADVDMDSFQWPGATLLAARETGRLLSGGFRRVALLQPAELPYTVRVEEFYSLTDSGDVDLVQRTETVGNRLLAKFDPEVLTPAQIETELAAMGASLGRALDDRGLYLVEFPAENLDALPQMLAELASRQGLANYAEPDYIVRTFNTPNDPRYLDGSLWGLHNTGQNGGVADADIDAPEGWAVRTDASTVVVGVVDTGIRLTHEDLAANLWVNPNEVADGTDTDGNGFVDDIHGINGIMLNGNPNDDQGHGTHCAGTIGAVGDNGLGVVGAAWNVKLMGLKFLSASGGGAVADAIACINYGVANGADILSNSWGGGGFSQALLESIEAARDAGVLFVVAAGNSASNNDLIPIFPASLPVDNIVAVASTTRTDAISTFSCFGQGSVDIGAPGSDILSTGFASDNTYVTMSGTSMATPHVAGAMAVLRAQFPEDNWANLIARLYRGGDVIPSLADGVVGTGLRLNLHGGLTTATGRHQNDDFAEARTLYGDRVVLRTTLRGATADPGQPTINGQANAKTIWFNFTPAASGLSTVTALAGESLFDPMTTLSTVINYDVVPADIEVFTGDALGNLTPVGAGANEISFVATAGTTYRIAVAGQNGVEGLLMLDVTGAPSNSTLGNAITLEVGNSVSGTNRNALSEPGEPAHAGQPAAASIWYKWTSNVAGRILFTTRGSDFDTMAAVYSGPSENPTFASLVPVASNDNEVGRTTSRIEFQALPGVTYYFAVDGKTGATGAVIATLAIPPSNDHFDEPAIISGTDISRALSTFFASRQAGEPIPFPGNGRGESVWFLWTAPESGRTTVDMNSSFFPGLIAVYTGDAVNALTLVARDGAGNRFPLLTFDAVQGTTYRILVDAWSWSLINVNLNLKMTPVPGNDNFAAATEMQGVRATIVGSNVGSNREDGEPNIGHGGGPSVWYKWTAPTTDVYGIYGERLNRPDLWQIVLNVFTGPSVDALTHVKEDLGNGIGRDAFVFWNAVAGETYYIQVTGITENGIAGAVGPFSLDLRPRVEHVAPNDNFANASELDPATPLYNFRTHSYGTTAEPGEPAHATYEAAETLWWKVTAAENARYVFSTALSEGSRAATVYRTTNPAAPAFDNLVEVANNAPSAPQFFNEVAWEATAGTTYYIVTDRMAGGRGRHIVHFQRVPDNYVFAGRATLSGENAQVVIQNHGAIREENEPTLGAVAVSLGHRSLWWSWTAPSSGIYQLDTIGSETPAAEDGFAYPDRTIYGFNSRLGVYTGNALGALTEVAFNNNRTVPSYGNSWIDYHRNSRLEFTATAGTTYIFLVNGENTDQHSNPNQTNTGLIRLNLNKLEKPANDDFANAIDIPNVGYQMLTNTFGATKETGEPNHGGITAGRTLWWKWTAPESGTFVASTAGNLYDDYHARRTGIGVYTGSTVDNLTTIVSNQDGAGPNTGDNTWSLAQFNAVAGTTYYFGVDAAFAGNLSFIFTRPPANDNFADATVMQGSRWTAHGHNLGATKEPGESMVEWFFNPPDSNFRSVWWRWTAPVSGTINVDTLGSQMYNVLAIYTGNSVNALTPITAVPLSSGNPFNGESERRARSGNMQQTFNAVAGTTYYITVQGAGSIIPSSGPITVSLSGPPAVPFAPEDFTATRTNPSTIDLTWSDVAVDEEYYLIERSLDGSNWTLLQQTPPNTTSFSDPAAVGELTDYFYRIRAVNSVGQSAWVSAAVVVPKPPMAPVNLAVNAVSAYDLAITWSPAPTALSHRLERSTTGGATWSLLANLGPNASAFTDVGLTPGTTYHYRVRGANEQGTGEWTAPASGTTQALGDITLSYPESAYAETAGSFTATVTRSGTSGDQVVFLTANSPRISVPVSITIPNGQSSVDFVVTIHDDEILNPTDTVGITAFAPAALMGESFSGPLNSELAGQNTGWGWGAAWIGVNASPTLVEPSLSYTKNGSIGTAGTRAARLANAGSGGQAYRAFSQKYSSGSVWVSTLLYRDSTNHGTQIIFRDNPGSGAWGRVIYQNNTNHWVIEASGAAATTPNPNPVQQLLGSNPYPTTFFVVMEFDFTARKIRAWLNPDVSGASPTNALATNEVDMQSTMTGINRVDISGHSNLDQFDEIRVANSFQNLYGGLTTSRNLRLNDDEATPATPSEQWLDTHFDTTVPGGAAAWTADPDGDGVPNLLEYALGGNPAVPNSASTPTPAVSEGQLTLGFTPSTTQGLTYLIEASDDLTTWTTLANVTHLLVPGQPYVHADSANLAEAPRRFLRLRVVIENP